MKVGTGNTTLFKKISTKDSHDLRPVDMEESPTIQAEAAIEEAFLANVHGVIHIDPLSFEEAIQSPQAEEWKKAMETEYQALVKMGVWKVVPKPNGRTPIKSKWVFKTKLDENGFAILRPWRCTACIEGGQALE